jgi:hypothetical protein
VDGEWQNGFVNANFRSRVDLQWFRNTFRSAVVYKGFRTRDEHSDAGSPESPPAYFVGRLRLCPTPDAGW